MKSGIIPEDAFFSILALNGISLEDSDRAKLVKGCKGMSVTGPGNQAHGGEINYKEAIALLNIRLDDLDSDPLTQPWTIR